MRVISNKFSLSAILGVLCVGIANASQMAVQQSTPPQLQQQDMNVIQQPQPQVQNAQLVQDPQAQALSMQGQGIPPQTQIAAQPQNLPNQQDLQGQMTAQPPPNPLNQLLPMQSQQIVNQQKPPTITGNIYGALKDAGTDVAKGMMYNALVGRSPYDTYGPVYGRYGNSNSGYGAGYGTGFGGGYNTPYNTGYNTPYNAGYPSVMNQPLQAALPVQNALAVQTAPLVSPYAQSSYLGSSYAPPVRRCTPCNHLLTKQQRYNYNYPNYYSQNTPSYYWNVPRFFPDYSMGLSI